MARLHSKKQRETEAKLRSQADLITQSLTKLQDRAQQLRGLMALRTFKNSDESIVIPNLKAFTSQRSLNSPVQQAALKSASELPAETSPAQEFSEHVAILSKIVIP